MTDSLGASLIPAFAAKKLKLSLRSPRQGHSQVTHRWPHTLGRGDDAAQLLLSPMNKEIAFIRLYIVLDSKKSINNNIGASVFALARRNEQEYRPL